MNRARADRFIIFIVTLACIAFTAESILMRWEYWVPPLLIAGIGALWALHITQRSDEKYREAFYFIYSGLLVFFHGVHETSFFDVSLVVTLFMAAFSLLDKYYVITIVLIEYFIIMAIQMVLQLTGGYTDFDKLQISRVCLHIGVVVGMYFLCRLMIANRLAAEDSMRRKEDRLKDNDADTDDFLSNVSHELRTPINVVNGMSSIFLKNNESSEVELIRSAGIRLSNQIEDILDFTEIKRKENILEEEKYMATSLINDIVVMYGLSDRPDLELIVDLDPKVPSMLKGDIKKLHKIFRHLLDNSIKFTKTGGVYIRVFVLRRDYGVNLEIEVSDTGVGMSRKDIALASNGFYQANKERNREVGGIGIGLPIVYGFVHAMGGFVKIESKKGAGTTVHLSIPQEVLDPTPSLNLSPDFWGDVVFYVRPEKYKIPQLREYYKTMAVNLAKGFNLNLLSAANPQELERLVEDRNVSHIFMGQEEYEEDPSLFGMLKEKGISITVSVRPKFEIPRGSEVTFLPKPLYALPIVRVLNRGTGFSGISDEEKPGRITFDGVRVLVVDDEPMNLVVETGIFREYGMISETAESGKEAIDKFLSKEYDVIFMDHMIPGMDGVEAMKRIKDLSKDIKKVPVMIALTANALSDAKEMFMKEGFDGFIAKPVDIEEFERILENLLPDELVSHEGRVDHNA